MNRITIIAVSAFLALCSIGFANELLVLSQYPTIQSAIDTAVDGDTVIVADGVYAGTGNRSIDFLGKAITVQSENGPENCIIDCENSGQGFHFHNNEDANSVLDGFTITNGYASQGGAIYCYSSSPTILNCNITGNSANYYGGADLCRSKQLDNHQLQYNRQLSKFLRRRNLLQLQQPENYQLHFLGQRSYNWGRNIR